jgi:hypothetical protein
MSLREPPPVPQSQPVSTGTKVVAGTVAAGVIGGLIAALAGGRRKPGAGPVSGAPKRRAGCGCGR